MGESRRNKKKFRINFKSLSKKPLFGYGLLTLIVVLVVWDTYSRTHSSNLMKLDSRMVKGNPNANVKVVEFVDFECPECAEGSRLIQRYFKADPHSLYIGAHLFPLSGLNSMYSARYAYCSAQQDMFWEFSDILFERQDFWKSLKDIKPYMGGIAENLQMNLKDLHNCIDDQATFSAIVEDKALGEAYFVKSTPTYFINGEMIVGLKELRKSLKALLGNL